MFAHSGRIVFLDRDGVLNTKLPPYIHRWEDYVLYPWTLRAMRQLRENGGQLFLMTNQSGIGRGYFSEDDLNRIHTKLQNRLKEANAQFTELYYCPHEPDADCDCRKPDTGMLRQAAETYQFNPKEAWVVGDSWRDIQAGQNFSAKTILIEGSHFGSGRVYENLSPTHRVETLLDASEIIIKDWEAAS